MKVTAMILLAVASEASAVHLSQHTIYAPPKDNDYVNSITLEQAEFDAKEKAAEKAKEFEAKNKNTAETKFDELKNELRLFSRTLDKDHFKSASKIRDKLKRGGLIEEERLNKARVTARDVFEKAFKFSNVAQNEYALA